MKKQLFFFSVVIILLLFGCKTNNYEPCQGCFGDEPGDFRVIDYEPAWSPDAKWIAFCHGESGRSGIYLISPDGKDIRKWHDGIPETPAWSPDGQWIAFSEGAQIWKKKINGGSLTQLTFEGRNFFPSWSPDGEWITFDGWIPDEIKFYGIFKMRNNGKEKVLFRYDANEGDMRMPDWTDYSTIVYARYSPQFYSTEIFSMDINGKNEARLTFNDADDYYPKFSNNKIAFSSKPRDKPQRQIWVMDADGSNLKQLTDTPSYACDWSPDGQYIVYTDARADNGRLWIMDADGGNKRQLTFEYHFTNF